MRESSGNVERHTEPLHKSHRPCGALRRLQAVSLGHDVVALVRDAQAASRRRTVQRRNLSGLRFLRRFRLAGAVEGDRLANERLEGGLVHFFSFVDVDRAAYVAVETRVEETARILQSRALGEGELDGL